MFPFTQKHKFIPSFLRAIVWTTFSATSPNLTTCWISGYFGVPHVLVVHLHTMKLVQNTKDGTELIVYCSSQAWHHGTNTLARPISVSSLNHFGWKRLKPPLVETWSYGGVTAPLTFAKKHFISCIYSTTKNYWWFTFRKVVVVGGLLPKRTTYSAICWPHISQLELFVKNVIRLAWKDFTKTEWLKSRSLHKKDVDVLRRYVTLTRGIRVTYCRIWPGNSVDANWIQVLGLHRIIVIRNNSYWGLGPHFKPVKWGLHQTLKGWIDTRIIARRAMRIYV